MNLAARFPPRLGANQTPRLRAANSNQHALSDRGLATQVGPGVWKIPHARRIIRARAAVPNCASWAVEGE